MIIMSQSGKLISDWVKIKKVYSTTNQKGCAVLAGFDDGDAGILGTYRTEEQCLIALGRFFYALVEKESSYQFPQPNELPDNKTYFGAGGGRRHGGS